MLGSLFGVPCFRKPPHVDLFASADSVVMCGCSWLMKQRSWLKAIPFLARESSPELLQSSCASSMKGRRYVSTPMWDHEHPQTLSPKP